MCRRLDDDWTGLHVAVNEGNVDIVGILLKYKANIDAKTKMGRTPLHITVLRGVTGIVKVLVEYGANINCEDDLLATPLHYGAEHGHTDIVEYLLDRKADPTKRNKLGQHAYDIATVADIIKSFEKRGYVKNPDIPDYARAKLDPKKGEGHKSPSPSTISTGKKTPR